MRGQGHFQSCSPMLGLPWPQDPSPWDWSRAGSPCVSLSSSKSWLWLYHKVPPSPPGAMMLPSSWLYLLWPYLSSPRAPSPRLLPWVMPKSQEKLLGFLVKLQEALGYEAPGLASGVRSWTTQRTRGLSYQGQRDLEARGLPGGSVKPNLESRVQEALDEKVNVQGEQNQPATLSLRFSFSPSKTLRRGASSQCERGHDSPKDTC